MRRVTAVAAALVALVIAVAMTVATRAPSVEVEPAAPMDPAYARAVQPIFNRRCVPCHSCFDSPCQLNLQSFEGLDRGANGMPVYAPQRLGPAPLTRMFQDAPTREAWRRAPFGFYPVVDRTHAVDASRSILGGLIEARRRDPGGSAFDTDVWTTCPRTIEALDRELHDAPTRGMPFGFPPLRDDEASAVADWLARGAGGPPEVDSDDEAARALIAAWEAFLDAPDARSKLVARYVFEHLYYAHLRFEEAPGAWYRLVRSRTPPGRPVDEIATRRPYDDPQAASFFYRFRRVSETIVEKTHVPYVMSRAKLEHVRALFLDGGWSVAVSDLPSYAADVAANPFHAFAAIPARARYQFLLDDAAYHVRTFIHGPVCRGQTALDVIEEHFLIFFLDPSRDPAVTDAAYLARLADDLALPAAGGDSIEAAYVRFKVKELAYLKEQSAVVASMPGRSLSDLWHGGGTNPDAVLTVYRHFDNAFVLRGAIGGTPKTAWVIDYPIFERMYYDLVAGFDVYGTLIHQVSTREYMNLLRIESEGQLLRFLPSASRKAVHDAWYRGRVAELLADVHDASYVGPEPTFTLGDGEPKDALIRAVVTRELAAVAGPREPIQWTDVTPSSDPLRARVETSLRDVTAKPGPFVQPMPDTVILRVRRAAGDLVYTVVRNRSHASVEFLIENAGELLPAEDTLHVVGGIITSRPNLFLVVGEQDWDAFVAAWRALAPGDGSWDRFVHTYGVRRSDPAFWAAFDALATAFPVLDPIGAGVLDLSRYTND